MEIKYLTYLRDNPVIKGPHYERTNESIQLSEIVQLENLFNEGKPFPPVLKELLFLAGGGTCVLDRGRNKTQQEMQEHVRKCLVRYNRSINRSFYAIDVYNPGDQMLFIYLDEGDDPIVYNAVYEEPIEEWLSSTMLTIAQIINGRIDNVKKGWNPF
ncbi:hypothetical protein [Pedobacter sp. UBA5917]|jgi:hypothetical protein|uniref:hypothetical protein n=1 Tax=Pedobacter sp. UBA5917 TaxID=1947061 RepID=UPI0025E089C6|nr:hypothetical protein [Pedobacter sp. UBA5917]